MLEKVKLLIYEDNAMLRKAIQDMISLTDDIICVGAFSNTKFISSQVSDLKPDIVLMDIEMPGMDGIESTNLVHQQYPNVRVLIQTVFDNSDKIFKALCAGASGYILKSDSATSQLNSIREVYAGGLSMSSSIAAKVLQFFTNKNVILVEPNNETINISDREKEILKLMQDGKKAKQIADELFISYETARTHIKNIYKKLHVASRTEAIYKALQQGIL